MTRAAVLAAREIVDGADFGGYAVPAAIVKTLADHDRLGKMSVPQPDGIVIEEAATTLLDGGDLAKLAQQVDRGETARRQADIASTMVGLALDQARDRAEHALHASHDELLAELVEAHGRILQVVREHAPALDGIDRSRGGWNVRDDKAHDAMAAIDKAGRAYRTIQRVRSMSDRITGQVPQHDSEGLYRHLRRPLELFPNRGSTQRVQIPWPEDHVELMLYLVGPAAIAQPWLPSVSESDAAWLAGPLGERRKQLDATHENTMAIVGGR